MNLVTARPSAYPRSVLSLDPEEFLLTLCNLRRVSGQKGGMEISPLPSRIFSSFSRTLTGALALLLLCFGSTAQATITVSISGTEVSVSGDSTADRPEFSVSGGGYLEFDGKSDVDGDGSTNDILVSAITRFEFGGSNDTLVFTGSNAFNFLTLSELRISEAETLEVNADLDLAATGSGVPSSASISANLSRMAVISGASIKTAHGDFDLMANGQGQGNDPGITILNSVIEAVGNGGVMLTGMGSASDGSAGILVDQSSVISTTAGPLNLTGTGGGEHDNNIGVQVASSCSVFSIAGDLWITGNGGGEGGGTGNHGVVVNGDLLCDGNMLDIMGHAGGKDGPFNRGVEISGATIEGTANFNINGVGAAGDGVQLTDASTIFTPTGDIQITGSVSNSLTNPAHGVVVEGTGPLIESETGSIHIFGDSGDGDMSMGVLISDGSIVRSITAKIMINGTAGGMILSDGIRFEDTAQISSLAGDVEMHGESDFGRGIYADGTGMDIGGNTSGGVYFYTDDYEIRAPVSSQGFVQIQPKTDGNGIEVGASSGSVNLEQDEIDFLMTPELVIGGLNNTTGDVTIDNVDFAQSLTVEADASITVNEVNSGSLWIHDVTLIATGDVHGGSSTKHIEAANLEFEVDGDVGGYSPLLIDADDLKVVANSADFGGSGTFDGAHIDVVGTTTFRNGFVFSVSSGLFVGINQDSGSIISVIGRVGLNNTNLTYAVDAFVSFAIGDSINLINNDGTDVVRGRFSGIYEGDIIGFSPKFQVSYAGGSGNDVSFTVVP
ncbi:MAG: hypothetical protein ACI8UO_004808 [Verrucomicrobiales bacterium]